MPNLLPTQIENYFEKPKEPKVARKVLGDVLRQRRKAAKLTLQEAAAQLNVSLSTVQRTEKGQRNITLNDVIAMSAVYGCESGQVVAEADALMRERKQN